MTSFASRPLRILDFSVIPSLARNLLFSSFSPLLLLLFLLSTPAQAGTLSGTVFNRTTGKPEANVVLDLLSPTQGMTELATTTSDAQGNFSVTKDSIGMTPILIRATVHDVSFNTFAPPGRSNVQVEVYDISKDPKIVSVPQHIIIFQPQDSKLLGAEEYTIDNASNPPVAYFRTEGNFDFAIPDSAKLGQVSATTSMGMAVAQASIDKGKGRFAIAYPFRPGQTQVRLSYDVPYGNNTASLKLPASYSNQKVLVVVPPGLTVTGDGLVAAGQEQGMIVYTHDPLPSKGLLSLTVSGVPSGPATAADQAGQEGNSRQEQGPEVIAAPSRLNDFKWYLFAGLIALFAMGALMLSRKQVVVAASDEAGLASDAMKPAKSGSASKTKKSAAPPAVPGSNHNASAEVDEHVATSLESLKEQIFRLELRRQAGTISEDDYAREKARFDKLLRDMVQS